MLTEPTVVNFAGGKKCLCTAVGCPNESRQGLEQLIIALIELLVITYYEIKPITKL